MGHHYRDCPVCHGTGEIETSGDLHRSAGVIPCPWYPTVRRGDGVTYIVPIEEWRQHNQREMRRREAKKRRLLDQ